MSGIRLITRRSQVQILPPPPSKEPAQRPFPGNRGGPLVLQGTCSYNTCTTDLTFGFGPDGQQLGQHVGNARVELSIALDASTKVQQLDAAWSSCVSGT